jgi:hypothetical protein
MASTCFQHYLLILRRRCTNGTWYIAWVLCQLATSGLEWNARMHARNIPSAVCVASPEDEQEMLETYTGQLILNKLNRNYITFVLLCWCRLLWCTVNKTLNTCYCSVLHSGAWSYAAVHTARQRDIWMSVFPHGTVVLVYSSPLYILLSLRLNCYVSNAAASVCMKLGFTFLITNIKYAICEFFCFRKASFYYIKSRADRSFFIIFVLNWCIMTMSP